MSSLTRRFFNMDEIVLTSTGAAPLWVWGLGLLLPATSLGFLCFYLFAGLNPIWLLFPLFLFVVAPTGLDLLLGPNRRNPSEEAAALLKTQKKYDVIAYLHIPMYFCVFVTAVAIVGLTHPPLWAVLVLAFGAGLINGNAINIGHELGHRRDRLNPRMAKIALSLSGYGHFTMEHNRGHHKNVATPQDCASSRLGESVYAFALRELPGAFIGGWREEKTRLQRKGLPLFHWRNEILQVYGVTIVITALLVGVFGPAVLGFIMLHHFISWLALTKVNYIEHYGLKRERRADGRYQLCEPKHSWNSNHMASNILSLNLQRHSDHHANPSLPYQTLRDFDDVPTLPLGYPGSIMMALVPPLWFSVMDKRVLKWADGDLEKTNLCPRAAHRYGVG